MLIREVLSSKSDGTVVTVSPDATVRELVRLLSDHNVGALVVSGDGTTVQGIVSERDIVRQLHHDPEILGATVESIMTSEVHTCDPQDQLDDLMRVMTERRFRHVPVVERDRLVGIISIGDVVKHKISRL